MIPFEQNLSGKKILITGHTGFTGSWATLWLNLLQVELLGFSLPSETVPSLFNCLKLEKSIPTIYGDIRDYQHVLNVIQEFKPDAILHLAAQPLVRRSYREPMETFSINTQGTAHILEAARQCSSVRGVVCITTDKVYRNKEWIWPYREEDELSGKDPYSASKSAAEMIINGYMASYPWQLKQGPAIAIARGGNIIGGGDWSEDRLIPDFVRAVINKETMTLRYPSATRPWQHVLALVHAYVMLLSGLLSDDPSVYARAWNLGPSASDIYSVKEVFDIIAQDWTAPELCYSENSLPEANQLNLDSTLANQVLRWRPVWDTRTAIQKTAEWYKAYYQSPELIIEKTIEQLNLWREHIV